MANFKTLFFKYLYLIVFAFIFECFFSKIAEDVILNLVENILFAIALISLLYLFNSEKLKKIYFVVSYLFFAFCTYFETAYYHLFKAYFSSSSIFVTLESNTNESKEFISFYLNKPIIAFTILFLVLVICSLLKVNRLKLLNSKSTKKYRLKSIVVFVGIVVFLKLSVLIVFNLPYLLLKSSLEYYIDFNKIENYKDKNSNNFANVSRVLDNSEDEVYIVIIGESISKSHMGIYGYYRETTPMLDEIKGELKIYNEVISPHTYTIESLSKSLTLGNYENPEKKFQGSIIQLLNQANFQTYWISNQRPVGIFDSQITKLAVGADKSYFLNTKHTNDNTTFDDVLLDKLDEVLVEKGNKKVVFLHMIGAHINYSKRFPKNFEYFKNKFDTKFGNEKAYKVVNSYDNAIRYSDSIIRKVIESVRKLNKNSFVLYFSDHGEEVYDEIDFSGHSADQIITKNIYEIPFFIWISEGYGSKRQISYNFNKKYMSDDLFHSIADLAGVKATQVDSSRSIFNIHFKERNRIINDTINFDSLYD